MTATQGLPITQGVRIWASPKPYNVSLSPDPEKIRLEFPSLARFKGQWYCAFREGEIHDAHPSGQGRIIRSADAVNWESVAVLTWDGGDVREPKLSVTAEGQLMVNTSITYVADRPHSNGSFGRLSYLLNGKLLPEETPPPAGDHMSDHEANLVACQSVTWLSADGTNWSSAYACPTGFNTWRWDVSWHNGMGYSIAQWGTGMKGPLLRTRDGKSWRVLAPVVVPEGGCNEAALAFGEDGTAYALLRHKQTIARLGIGKPPYYQDWQWKTLDMDWHGDGNTKPFGEVMRVQLGGPTLRRLSNGRLLGAGRSLGPERPDGPWRVDANDPHGIEDGRVTLFWVDPGRAVVTRFAEIDGTSYPGLVEHAGKIWVSYIVWWGDEPGVYLAKLDVPPA